MADGTQEFKALGDGTYESTVKDGSLTVVTSYDENFEITGTEVQKEYANVSTYAVSYTHLTLPTICSV